MIKLLKSFISIFKIQPSIDYLQYFFNKNTRIIIYTNATILKVDIPNIKYNI